MNVNITLTVRNIRKPQSRFFASTYNKQHGHFSSKMFFKDKWTRTAPYHEASVTRMNPDYLRQNSKTIRMSLTQTKTTIHSAIFVLKNLPYNEMGSLYSSLRSITPKSTGGLKETCWILDSFPLWLWSGGWIFQRVHQYPQLCTQIHAGFVGKSVWICADKSFWSVESGRGALARHRGWAGHWSLQIEPLPTIVHRVVFYSPHSFEMYVLWLEVVLMYRDPQGPADLDAHIVIALACVLQEFVMTQISF